MESKNIVFDVVGTLVSFDRLFQAVEDVWGRGLHAHGVQPKLLGHLWLEMADREYTYLSMSGRHVVFAEVFEALFYRALMYAGVPEPRAFATKEALQRVIGEWKQLNMRPDAPECIAKLRGAGFTVWCFTTADLSRVQGYFSRAGVEMPAENIISCDTGKVAKPIPAAYASILERFSSSPAKPWFAAAHMWDVAPAAHAGFRGAYATVLEGEPLPEIFGQVEVTAYSLSEMADKIIAAN